MAAQDSLEPPAPGTDMVTASRVHLTGRYADGVNRLVWELEERTMPDIEAVRAVTSAASAGETVDAPAIGAALVLMQAVRLEVDLLEADVFDAAESAEVTAEEIAAVLGLPGPDAVDARRRMLTAKRGLPRVPAPRTAAHSRPPGETSEAAKRAGLRARQAADRACEARRRREQLASADDPAQTPAARDAGREHAERESVYASEARLSAGEAAERVARGLLRAAEALDRCASRCGEWERLKMPGVSRQRLRLRATEYSEAARDYREMADQYRAISGDRSPEWPR